jgi:hypothetical protein
MSTGRESDGSRGIAPTTAKAIENSDANGRSLILIFSLRSFDVDHSTRTLSFTTADPGGFFRRPSFSAHCGFDNSDDVTAALRFDEPRVELH